MLECKITEDMKATFSTELHLRKMQNLVFTENILPDELKRFIPISFSLKNSQLSIVGGICGWISYDFSYIEAVWVDPAFRGCKKGQELVFAFESKVKQLNCSKVLVTTNSIANAKDFWKKLGYDLYNELALQHCKVQYFQKSI